MGDGGMNRELSTLTPEQQQILPMLVQAMGEMLKNNTEALEKLAAAQTSQNDRIGALEKQIRLNTLVTPQQVRYFNEAIRKRARELLDKRGVDDDKAVKKLGNAIRKDVLSRYGVGALHEIPKHEYSVTMNQIGMWSDALHVRDVLKEVRMRNADRDAVSDAGQAAGVDGACAAAGSHD